jgi:endonuclease/exonuclease/phosphatase family metal-dependent hydrolase
MTITIATWNIAGGRPTLSDERFDYDAEDLSYFAEELKMINPDIVALQESHKSDTRSVASELAGKIGLNVCIDEAISPSHIDPEYQLSLAVLSKLGSVHAEDGLRFPYPKFPLTLPNGQPAKRHDKGMQMIELEEVKPEDQHQRGNRQARARSCR